MSQAAGPAVGIGDVDGDGGVGGGDSREVRAGKSKRRGWLLPSLSLPWGTCGAGLPQGQSCGGAGRGLCAQKK